MVEALISSKTRLKLLQKFFLNSDVSSYLRNLESEFGESTNAIRIELNRLEKAGMLVSGLEGNKKIFRANKTHPLFEDLNKLMLKHSGLYSLNDLLFRHLKHLKKAYLTGPMAEGIPGGAIELILVGRMDPDKIAAACRETEKKTKRKIIYNVLERPASFDKLCEESGMKYLLLWEK